MVLGRRRASRLLFQRPGCRGPPGDRKVRHRCCHRCCCLLLWLLLLSSVISRVCRCDYVQYCKPLPAPPQNLVPARVALPVVSGGHKGGSNDPLARFGFTNLRTMIRISTYRPASCGSCQKTRPCFSHGLAWPLPDVCQSTTNAVIFPAHTFFLLVVRSFSANSQPRLRRAL